MSDEKQYDMSEILGRILGEIQNMNREINECSSDIRVLNACIEKNTEQIKKLSRALLNNASIWEDFSDIREKFNNINEKMNELWEES